MRSLSLLFATIILCLPAYAEEAEQKLASAYALFQKGDYALAIQEAKVLEKSSPEIAGPVAFFLASAHAKLQELDQAVPYFKKAVQAKYETPSLQYDYGQALFATHDLKEAEAAFKRSILAQFKVAASAYYVAFIRQLKEDGAGARDFYQRIQKLKSDTDKVKQPALYQLAELERENVTANTKEGEARTRALYLRVLPLYKRTRDFEKSTASYDQAETKIKEIEAEYGAIAARMRNGNPIPVKSYTLRLSQDLSYDSNVVTQAEQAILDVTDKDSLISKTALLAKYQFNLARTFSFIPELAASATYHLRRSTPRVYQNDNISISPALRTKYEHISARKPATGLLDFEFNLMLRDYLQAHKMPFYSRYFNLSLGERVNWLATGSTTAKVAMKLYQNYDSSRNFYSPQFSLQQNIKIFGQWDLQNTLTADYTLARDDLNDERNYKFSQSAALISLFEKVDVTPGISLTLKDTMKQKGTRGNELMISPSIEFARNFVEWLDTSVAYAYTKNNSESKTNYQYSKHELTFSAAHSF